MNILFISYWGINEGLTQASVIPHIKILSQFEQTKKIILVTIERESNNSAYELTKNSLHIPIYSKPKVFSIYRKFNDFIIIPRLLNDLCKIYKIDKILARSTPAGALAYKLSQITGKPFYVESFEPHAEYMKDTGMWHKWGIKYRIQSYWEKKQLKMASGIITVSHNYSEYLIKHNLYQRKLYTFPCAVDSSLFEFDFETRMKIRESLGFTKNQVVGVYAGKFGGLYLDIPELIFINKLLKSFPDLGIIILTEDNRNSIIKKLKKVSNPGLKIIVKNVSHSDIPKYLSAADFGLSFNKFFPSGKYLSPIKIGEYLASGLPVLMTEGIGDENNYLEKEKAGVLFNMENLEYKLNSLQKIMNEPDHRERISKLASKYRSFHPLKEIYKNLIFQD